MQLTENPIQSTAEDPCDLPAPTAPGVSVILFNDPAHQAKLVADARAWFDNQQTPVEFIVVSSQGPKLAPLSGSLQTESAPSFEAAIQSAKHEHVAVIDAVYRFDSAHWSVVNPVNSTEAFRSWSYAPSKAPGSRKILIWLYCQIMRRLLGVVKNRVAPGITTFTKTQLAKVDLTRLDLADPDLVSQLLSVGKSDGLAVEEHRCTSRQPELQWHKSNSSDPHLPKSKSVKRSIKRSLQFWFSQLAFPARRHGTKNATSEKTALATTTLLLLAAIILFTNSSFPLFEPDEARNAQLAMNIVETGQWTALSLSGEPYWDKPPLLAWMTAVSYKCFGISEWSTRLPSILTSLFLLAFMIIAGAKLIGLRAATIGTAALLLAWGFAFQTRYVTMDAMLTFFTTAATLGIAVGVRNKGLKKVKKSWLIASGIAIGLGILAKGPVCLVLTVPPIVVWMFLNREVSREAIRATVKLVPLWAAIVSAPWFIVTMATNPEFAWYFLWKHHVVRFSDAFNHQEPLWYYIPILWLFMFPASILLPRVIYVISSRNPKYRLLRTPSHGLLALSALWIVGFFSMSQCKLPAYVLPAFPMIALLIGVIVNFEFDKPTTKRTRFDRLPKRIAIGVSILSLVVGIASVYQFGNREIASFAVFSIAITASVFLLVQYPLKRSTPRKNSWLATSAIGLIFVFLGVSQLVPSIARDRSILNSIATDAQNRSSIPVIYFGRDTFASELYLPGREVVHIDEESITQLESLLTKRPQATIVASNENIERVKASFGANISITAGPGRHTFFASIEPTIRVASQPDGQKR